MNKTRARHNFSSKRPLLLTSVSLIAIVSIFFMEPVAQDPTYHQFANEKIIFSIPNFWNVVSNLPFILVGILGLHTLVNKSASGILPDLRMACILFFTGLIFTGIGSSYYHWNPNHATLVWDRLPMTLSFMAFFTIVLGEHISKSLAIRLFYPLLLVGFSTVIYWHITELKGTGDLRPYVLVQFLPIILIPLILWLYPSPFNGRRYIILVLVAYVTAKLMEYFDHEIHDFLGIMSGHPIKHVVAAVGAYCFYVALNKRRLLPIRQCAQLRRKLRKSARNGQLSL